jgi:integrase/recombinase XerD
VVAGAALENAGPDDLQAYEAHIGRLPSGHRRDIGTGLTRIARYLKPLGILNRPEPATPADPWLQSFDQYLRDVKGLAWGTREGYYQYLRPFILGLCHSGRPEWSELTGPVISRFLKPELDKARAAKKTIVASMRAFIRFLVAEGLVSRGLLRAIPRVRCWRYANLPEPLTMEQHEKVLKLCQDPSSGPLRNRAFIALLAQLGVRGGEVRQLTLDDINWAESTLHIRHSKSGRERVLPLPAEAGALLAEYIHNERPKTLNREVFLVHRVPRCPFGEAAASYIVRQYLHRAGIRGPRLGTHCFRHTAATLMGRNGATLKEVADVLGHRSLATTGIYVKLDQAALAEVAMPWIGAGI